jgi:hypothetical protein
MHIYDFITDAEQAIIKQTTQVVFNPDRFEDVLSHYQQRFFQSFENNPGNAITLTATESSKYLPASLAGDADVQQWMTELLTVFKRQLPELRKIMDDVIDCYYLFLRGRQHTAVLKMFDVLERYEMTDTAMEELLGLFFRCTSIRAGANPGPDQEVYYYHIPFNLRHLIKNQRFSVSGIPIWYGGASLICSYYEMRKTNMVDYDDLAISAWGYNPLCFFDRINDKAIKPKIKVFDVTNELYDAINTAFYEFLSEVDPVKKKNIFQNYHVVYRGSIQTALKKFVLRNLCTFKSTKDNAVFHEEYVIPQILTEAVRLHKYDGILFPSTQFMGKDVHFTGNAHMNLYQSNLALFTEYSYNDPYDQKLIKNFAIEIITPDKIAAFDFTNKDTNTIIEIQSWIEFLKKKGKLKADMQKRYIGLLEHLEKKLNVYQNLVIDKTPYLETYPGKAELFGIVEYTRYLTSQVRHIFREEFEGFVDLRKNNMNDSGTIY